MNADEHPEQLSDQGRQRKHVMLENLQRDMVRVHRRRRARRHIAAAAVAPVLCVAAWWLWNAANPPPRAARDVTHQSTGGESMIETSSTPRAVVIEIVRTSTKDFDSRIVTTRHDAKYLTDDGLLNALAQMDRHTGLIRSDSRVWLTSDVTDKVVQ